jgi:hypothetical protein
VRARGWPSEDFVVGRGRLSGHHFGLALDVAELVFDDGSKLAVKTDWKDHREIDPCGGEFLQAEEREQRLRELTCATAKFDIFSVILTPHYNRAHHDHLHVELDRTQYQFVR